jgi:hypothetical protein
MPTPSDFGDGATVIEPAAISSGYPHAHALGAHAASGSSRGKGAESSSPVKMQSTFARTPDYFSEERPYVVHIGKKGVLGALQELDEHLRQVRAMT